MTLRDVQARQERLAEYYERAMERAPGTDPGGVPDVKVLRESYDGSPQWAHRIDEHLARYWPGEWKVAVDTQKIRYYDQARWLVRQLFGSDLHRDKHGYYFWRGPNVLSAASRIDDVVEMAVEIAIEEGRAPEDAEALVEQAARIVPQRRPRPKRRPRNVAESLQDLLSFDRLKR